MQEENPRGKLNPPVFYAATAFIAILVAFSTLFSKQAESTFQLVQDTIVANGSWFYVLTVGIILITVIYLGLSRFGEIKLGPDHSTPDYSYISWFAMLFSAGMGIGLMFFGVAEPVMHFMNPPVGDPETVNAAREAMNITFFHWGLHAWAIYAIVALILAFFSYRHGLPLTLRSALYPLIGDKIYGPIGHVVDVFAVIGTVFGVATSLGFGVKQVNSGLNYLFDIPVGTMSQVILIGIVTLLAIISVTTGLDKGIRRLSELNMGLAAILLIVVLIGGPTVYLLQAFVQNTGAYVSSIVDITFNLFAYEKTDWLGGWTIFYWGWWMSWAPFVGLFIARVSRGRTLREFAMGVLFIPSGFTLLWMTVFGNSAIDLIMNQGKTALAEAVSNDVAISLFAFLENFPLSTMLSFIATVMVIVFFVTSSDSGSMVVDMLCSNGNDNTPLWQRIFWASTEGVVAAVLLIAGGLGALQTMAIASALPFAIVLLIATYGLLKALRVDIVKRESLHLNVSPVVIGHNDKATWENRLASILDYPNKKNVNNFINSVVKSAMQRVVAQLKEHNVEARYEEVQNGRVVFTIDFEDQFDFHYEVRRYSYDLPDHVAEDDDNDEADEQYYRAEVHLREGGQDYDIMGWPEEAVINDIVEHYQKHLHFLHSLR